MTALPQALGTTTAIRRVARGKQRQLSLSGMPLSVPPSRRMARNSGRRRRIRARGRRRSRPGVAGVVALHTFGQKATTTARTTTRNQGSPSLCFHAGAEAELAFTRALGWVVGRFHNECLRRAKSCREKGAESMRSMSDLGTEAFPRLVGNADTTEPTVLGRFRSHSSYWTYGGTRATRSAPNVLFSKRAESPPGPFVRGFFPSRSLVRSGW